MSEHPGITLIGLFSKATTLIDGGWRITFDLNQDEAEKVLQLSQFRDCLLQLACIPVPEEKDPFDFSV